MPPVRGGKSFVTSRVRATTGRYGVRRSPRARGRRPTARDRPPDLWGADVVCGLQAACAGERRAGDGLVPHDVAGLRRVDELPVARVDADVADRVVVEDEVARLHVVPRD